VGVHDQASCSGYLSQLQFIIELVSIAYSISGRDHGASLLGPRHPAEGFDGCHRSAKPGERPGDDELRVSQLQVGGAVYIGGLVKRSPYRATVPSNDHWFVAIDLGGYEGRVDASVAVEPPPRGFLPGAPSQRSPISNVAVRQPVPPPNGTLGDRTWDVFMSHASEDKPSCARPLFDALVDRGVSVWLDESELRIGHSLRQRIDEGIRSSRFGVVILSPAFFGKGWTNHELDGLVTRNVAGEQSLLPIWHTVTAEDVRAYSPSLADKVAVSTADTSIEEIAAQIAELALGGGS
jgi:TIR domain/Domain of unknown function (DUF1883)